MGLWRKALDVDVPAKADANGAVLVSRKIGHDALLYCAACANEMAGQIFWVSAPTVAKHLRISERAARRAMIHLKELGVLRDAGKAGRTPRYAFDLGALATPTPVRETPVRETPVSLTGQESRQPLSEKYATPVREGPHKKGKTEKEESAHAHDPSRFPFSEIASWWVRLPADHVLLESEAEAIRLWGEDVYLAVTIDPSWPRHVRAARAEFEAETPSGPLGCVDGDRLREKYVDSDPEPKAIGLLRDIRNPGGQVVGQWTADKHEPVAAAWFRLGGGGPFLAKQFKTDIYAGCALDSVPEHEVFTAWQIAEFYDFETIVKTIPKVLNYNNPTLTRLMSWLGEDARRSRSGGRRNGRRDDDVRIVNVRGPDPKDLRPERVLSPEEIEEGSRIIEQMMADCGND